ncbi:cytochrome c oxidase assembly protein [Sporosarcina obsidiansis]|uniref:cytochrome c oxidase assembly protein n=1 Tax=Sporosarcina obsidiansis TaxID=2660748 RepID=UPI00129B2A93|nr:cytochrome c oxidase assembly protein [Sporosarcina obsidiansis]
MLHNSADAVTNFLFGSLAMLALVFYSVSVFRTNRQKHLRTWPPVRTVFWMLGVLFSASAVIGPIAEDSHENFVMHMIGHVFLGMLGPLLLALAAPMTLLLRVLPVQHARRVSRLLKSRLASFYTHPIVASILNVGGLWLLYTTDLYMLMQHHLWLHVLIHIHVFVAGYLFTISLLYIDPVSRRFSYVYRTIIFIVALAGHGILSKYIYAYPPNGVPIEQAQVGAMLMYYGGDAVDVVIIILLFRKWFQATRPRGERFTTQLPSLSR